MFVFMNTGPQQWLPHNIFVVTPIIYFLTNKGMVRSDMSKPALMFFSLQEYTQQNPLSKF
jgi:hypothetical protein